MKTNHLLSLLLAGLAAWIAYNQTPSQAQPGYTQPQGPAVAAVAIGGVPVVLFPAGAILHYADIINPPDASEVLYVDIVAPARAGSATSIPVPPGAEYRVSGPIATPVSVVAATDGHPVVAVRY